MIRKHLRPRDRIGKPRTRTTSWRVVVGAAIFLLAAAGGSVFAGLIVWADLEAALFNPAIRGDTRIASVRCPMLLAWGETGTVSASFFNPGPNPTSPTVTLTRSRYSALYHEEELRRFQLDPGETVRLAWEVRGEAPSWGLFVLVHLYQHASYPLRSASQSCGILVLDIPFASGRTFAALVTAASAVGMAGGLLLHIRGAHRTTSGPARRRARPHALGALGLLVLVAIAAGALGWSLVGLAALVLLVVLAIVMAALSLTGE